MEKQRKNEEISWSLPSKVDKFHTRASENLKKIEIFPESTIESIEMVAYGEGYFQAIKDAENLLGKDVSRNIYLKTYVE